LYVLRRGIILCVVLSCLVRVVLMNILVSRTMTMYICIEYVLYPQPCFKNILRLKAGYPALRCHIVNNQQVTRTTHRTHEPPHNRTHERNTRPNHLAAIGGCATTVRATSHARVGGRAEVSMGSRVEVRRALARARVRRAPAGPSRPCQLEASRGHAGDAAPAAAVASCFVGDKYHLCHVSSEREEDNERSAFKPLAVLGSQ